MTDVFSAQDATALGLGRHPDPFAVLGVHQTSDGAVVRTFQPHARRVELIAEDQCLPMKQIEPNGLFEVRIAEIPSRYQLRNHDYAGHVSLADDPYRFASPIQEFDLHLLAEGCHLQIYDLLGAHPREIDGVAGVHFATWAPNAARVSVVGDFNQWDGRSHCMRRHPGAGIWDIFVPGIEAGTHYKFELLDARGDRLPLKSDPYSRYCEAPPGNASIVFQSRFRWQDQQWMARRESINVHAAPMSIYEVHLGSWRRGDGNQVLTYAQLAEELIAYLGRTGFTHVELLPITEHPFDGSWGYQPIGMFAPTGRFGSPDDFREFVDRLHQADIGIIVDWVPAHFPRDEYGLARFDGTALFEHEDPRRGAHADWGTLIYNYGRREVFNYLIANALFWVREFHIDALRVDAVASMLYLDYSRQEGQWLPNEHGGRENLEAVAFLRELNCQVHAAGAFTIAEESTAWPSVSGPVEHGGLGFSFKWNMGWMNDTLSYMKEDPVHRKHHHDRVTFGLVYAFDENFILPLSHDEVVHGKGSLLGRMPGDQWQQFANLRAYLGLMFAHPGKKLLFMGGEFGQVREWNHDQSLDWHLLDDPCHAGVSRLVSDLNRLYRNTPALYEIDFQGNGFTWLDWQDSENSVFSWLRVAENGEPVVCITNFTPVLRHNYRIGVPAAGNYLEVLNTDSESYGGSGVGNLGRVAADATPSHGNPASLELTLPPLATLILQPETL